MPWTPDHLEKTSIDNAFSRPNPDSPGPELLRVSPQQWAKVVHSVSGIERICVELGGEQRWLHLWYHASMGRWSHCCHPRPAQDGDDSFRRECSRFGVIHRIVALEGEAGMRRRLIARQD